MAKGLVQKTYTVDQTFTPPAGVKKLYLSLFDLNMKFKFGASCGVDTDGNAYAWGVNTNGGLGLGDVIPRSSPVLVLGGKKWRQIQTGASFPSMAGLDSLGDAYAWGINTNGGLGVGDVTPRSSPVLVLGGKKWKQISVAGVSFFGIDTAGAAWAAGLNASGQLGLGDVTPRSSPVAVLGGLTFKKVVSSPNLHCLGLTTAGAAYAWGNNSTGNLGVGDVTPRSSPVAVLGGLTFTDIAVGTQTCFGITSAGAIYAWGTGTGGQLGVGDNGARSSPVAVVGGLTFSKIMSTGGTSSFGIQSDGTAYAWGANANGQLGLGDVTGRSSPVAVLGGFKFKIITSQASNSIGLATDGKLYAWGANANGELGLGDVTPRSSPVAVLGSKLWYGIDEELVGQATVDVTPGTSYSIALFAQIITFNTVTSLYDGCITPKILVEYYA